MKNNKGITLIALVITIIVMLVLTAVTITVAVNGGLFEKAGKARKETQNEIEKEQELANEKVKIEENWYNSLQEYVDGILSEDQSDTGTSDSTGKTYTWDKYSFNITYISSGREYSAHSNYTVANTQGTVTAYGKVRFANNTFYVSDSWRGCAIEYYCNLYLNYPFMQSQYQGFCETDPSYNNLRYIYGEGTSYGTCIVFPSANFKDCYNLGTISKGDYLYGEVTSTDSTAYPTNGFLDGFWYVYKSAQ